MEHLVLKFILVHGEHASFSESSYVLAPLCGLIHDELFHQVSLIFNESEDVLR
jgi:hypothetical protein